MIRNWQATLQTMHTHQRGTVLLARRRRPAATSLLQRTAAALVASLFEV